ncbi:hypothetical protein TGAM01_v209391 [Trichoderma gamsii]|uniref:Uncharacterized protein n=1 Tax=Trichoderma gamsii TaxID=398673 RepID=A0A2P4ZBY0_9HYPO|nr:hypothetical protein TGAM01_v209391 [Trichoderma gamsii]PON21804.1 hypothetical protein TGAM01_v209391 [Trichoderma gamsii]
MHHAEAEGGDDDNTLANNSRAMTRSTRSLRSSHASVHGQGSAVSEQVPVRQHETAGSRKRNRFESEDELTGPAKHPRTRTYSATEVENWETVFIGIASRLDPEAVRTLLDDSKSQIKRQRSRIAQLRALIQQERDVHQGFEENQKERYAALEKDFRAHKNKMASILTANVEAFGPKISDDTIVGEWKQLCYKKEVFERDFGEIIKQAANLHLAMMRSKAIFVVQWAGNDSGEDDCRYDPETMIPLQDEVNATSSSHAVDINESPGVWKIGNADGENFDSVMVLCKSVVVVKEQKTTVVLE